MGCVSLARGNYLYCKWLFTFSTLKLLATSQILRNVSDIVSLGRDNYLSFAWLFKFSTLKLLTTGRISHSVSDVYCPLVSDMVNI